MGNVHPLKAYRARERLTQQGLADLVGVERTTVARWETGARKIDRDLVADIHEKTGVPRRELRPDLADLIEGSAQ